MHYCRCYSSFHFNIYALSLSLSLSLLFSSFCRPHDHRTPCRCSTCYPMLSFLVGSIHRYPSKTTKILPPNFLLPLLSFPLTSFIYNIFPHLFISSLLVFISSSLLRARAILTHATPQLHSQCLCSPLVCSSHISILLRWSPLRCQSCECDVMIPLGGHAFILEKNVRSSFPFFTFVLSFLNHHPSASFSRSTLSQHTYMALCGTARTIKSVFEWTSLSCKLPLLHSATTRRELILIKISWREG